MAMDTFEARRRELFFALRNRPLTDAEIVEAHGYGSSLNVRIGVSYRIGQPERELADAWTAQSALLRAAALQANAGYVGGANNSLFEIRELGT